MHPLLGTGGDGIYSGGSARLGQTHAEVIFVGSRGHDMGGRRGEGRRGEKKEEKEEKEERQKKTEEEEDTRQTPSERDVVNPPPPQSGDDRINGRADR